MCMVKVYPAADCGTMRREARQQPGECRRSPVDKHWSPDTGVGSWSPVDGLAIARYGFASSQHSSNPCPAVTRCPPADCESAHG